jgi:hypothetical protein
MDWLWDTTCGHRWSGIAVFLAGTYYFVRFLLADRELKRLKSSTPAAAPAPARSGAPPASR